MTDKAPAQPKTSLLKIRFLDSRGVPYQSSYFLFWGGPPDKDAPEQMGTASGTLDSQGILSVLVNGKFKEGLLYFVKDTTSDDMSKALAVMRVVIEDHGGRDVRYRLQNLGFISPTADVTDAAKRFQTLNKIPSAGGPSTGQFNDDKKDDETVNRLIEVHDKPDSRLFR